MLVEVVLLGLVGIILMYVYFTWTYGHWKERGVPFLEPLPFFGNCWELLVFRKTFRELMLEFYERGAGRPVIGFYQFRKPVLLLRDPELVRTVLVKDFSTFRDNSFVIHKELDPLAARNPFFLKGDEWKAVRSLLTPAFTTGKIKPQFPLMTSVCNDLVEHLDKEASKTNPDGLEAKELCCKFTTDVVSSCAFGIAGNSLKDPDAEIRRMGRSLLFSDFWNNLKMTLLLLMPGLVKILKVQFLSEEVSDFFRQLIREAISYREENKVVRNDYLQMLLQIRDKGKVDDESSSVRVGGVNMEYTEEDITAHALTFFIDGFETSSAAFSFALYQLALHPGIQARLRAEVDSVLKKYNGEVCHEAIQEMTYMDMVFNETLRLHPPGTSLDRVCNKRYDLVVSNGKTIQLEKGSTVIIPVEAIHMDREHFPDPEKFDPERFSEKRKARIKRYTFLPFGEGPRQCLGMKFALAQVKVGLMTIVSNFEIRTTRKTPVPLVYDPNYFLPAAKGGMWLNFVKRNSI